MTWNNTGLCLALSRQNETVIPGELPLVQELTSTLREWAVIWRKLYVVSFPLGLGAGGTLPGLSVCPAAEPSSAGVDHWMMTYLDLTMTENQQMRIPRVGSWLRWAVEEVDVVISSVFSQLIAC